MNRKLDLFNALSEPAHSMIKSACVSTYQPVPHDAQLHLERAAAKRARKALRR